MLALVRDRVGEKRLLMAWVRYDDQFPYNPKVTAVIAEDPGALGLHVLANTWTNGQKRKGHIPAHQPGILVCDKTQGRAWADLLVKHGLWHRLDGLCPECKDEYAELPPDLDGFVFHNASEYRAPGRDRVTPGTSQELSEKRRAAGRKGGQASARRRDEAKQKQANQATGQANQANGEQGRPEPNENRATAEQGFGQAAADGTGEGRPAETFDAEQANQANRVSKDSNLLLAGVSPVPVPVSRDASNEASAADEPRHTAEDDPAHSEAPPLVLISGEDIPAQPKKPKARKTRRKPDRTPLDDEADVLTNGYWDRYSKTTAQSWISIRQVVLGALNNDPEQRNDIARALDALGRDGRPVTQNTLTFALKEVRERRGQQQTGTDGPFNFGPLDNVNDLWKDRR